MSTAAQLDIMTAQEVAAMLRVSRQHLTRLAGRGEFPAIRIGGALRFDRADVMAWIEAQRNKGG